MTATLEAPVKKKRTTRTLKWVRPFGIEGVQVRVGSASIIARGPVGQYLAEMGQTGTLTFVDEKPSIRDARISLIRSPEGNGLLVAFYRAGYSVPAFTEYVGVCSTYRGKLNFTRKGSTRWLTIQGAT